LAAIFVIAAIPS